MLKPITLVTFLYLLILTTSLHSQPYQIPADLVAEIKTNQKNVSENPTSPEAYFDLSMSYAYTGMIERGLSALGKVKELDPHFDQIVVEKYEKLTKENPKNWKYWFKLAFGYYFSEPKDRERSAACFQKIIDQNPKHIWAMGYLALLKGDIILEEKSRLKEKNQNLDSLAPKYQDVIDLCKKAIEIEPNATGIHFLLGQAYFNRGYATDYFSVLGETFIVGKLLKEDKTYYKELGI